MRFGAARLLQRATTRTLVGSYASVELMSDPYNKPDLPFQGPLASIPKKPKWVVRSWHILLVLAVVGVVFVHFIVLREFLK